MKIAVTTTGPSLDAAIDPRFGRCSHFVFVETDDMSFEAVQNPNIALGGGAGIQSALLLSEKDVKFVLTGNCGPNAHQTLSAAEIGVITDCSGVARNAVEQFKNGQLNTVDKPNVDDHFGMATDERVQTMTGGGMGGGGGGGMGGGGGRGMGGGGGRGMGGGGGRGMGGGGGRGMGGGGGRGMGGGGGRGMGGGGGRGMGGGQGIGPAVMGPAATSPSASRPGIVAVVDMQVCNLCGACEDSCPLGAIAVGDTLRIDGEKCDGCGLCLEACPIDALSLRKA
jgi:predicted Fe-Mo cluster-binding NifX family protein/NAD-dependent dihydropyrimidine dehydrogenase PreA subunit